MPGPPRIPEAGESDVEQDQVGAEKASIREARRAVDRFTNNVEPVRLEQRANQDAKALVVIDDEDRVHDDMVAPATRAAYRASPEGV